MHTHRLVLLSTLTALPLLLSCGSTEKAPDASRAVPGVVLFSDAEGNQAAPLVDSELTNAGAPFKGGWYTYDDMEDCPLSEVGTAARIPTQEVLPTKGMTFPMTEYSVAGLMPPPEAETPDNKWGIRFWGGGYQKWGAGLGIGLNNPGGGVQVYDLAAQGFTGLRFWAISVGGPVDLKVKITDKWSEGDAPMVQCCFLDKAVCGDNDCGGGEVQGCFNAPAATASLTTEWKLFTFDFSEFQRGTWGSYVDGDLSHNEEPLVASEAYQIQFEAPAGADFNIVLDNVGFVAPNSMP